MQQPAAPTDKKKGKGQKSGAGSKKKNSKSKSAAALKKSGKKGVQPPGGNDLMAKLFEVMERHKEVRCCLSRCPVSILWLLRHNKNAYM